MVCDLVRTIDSHPALMSQEELDEAVDNNPYFPDEPMSVDEWHEFAVSTLAETDEWHIFRYVLGSGFVYVWNKMYGYGFKVLDEEGSWEELVAVFEELSQKSQGENQ